MAKPGNEFSYICVLVLLELRLLVERLEQETTTGKVAVHESQSPRRKNTMPDKTCPGLAEHSALLRFTSAVFYAGCSLLITVVNKTVLTSFRFPSYMCLGIGQMITTIVVLYAAKRCKIVQFQDFDKSILIKMFPLPLLYVGNHITGLGGTKKLSLPMFTVLRKFTILMTMILEVYILRKTFPNQLVCSVVTIVFGAMVAASSDLAFDIEGYTFILLNDAFTAAGNVYTKKKVGNEGLGKYDVIFYNALIIVIPTILASAFTGDLHKVNAVKDILRIYRLLYFLFDCLTCFYLQAAEFENWSNVTFIFCFALSCFMGYVTVISSNSYITISQSLKVIFFFRFVLMYSIVLCSYYNSALTTTVVGAVKNVAVAYIGMFVGGDYLFSWTNFIGLSICMSGGLLYSYLTFNTKSSGDYTQGTQDIKIDIIKDSTGRYSTN
ncbi:hypothetical protein JOB18_000923 [Solea senegalensis]|uniref:Sugar phosphate transporter domain-containing protein n=1 Tax=Solea senegalensis TaxID=28829 RepID=A0AAV6QFV6_SOLSE|nr:hypothetical protein JOB18_000923 [Solea senegalensis]